MVLFEFYLTGNGNIILSDFLVLYYVLNLLVSPKGLERLLSSLWL